MLFLNLSVGAQTSPPTDLAACHEKVREASFLNGPIGRTMSTKVKLQIQASEKEQNQCINMALTPNDQETRVLVSIFLGIWSELKNADWGTQKTQIAIWIYLPCIRILPIMIREWECACVTALALACAPRPKTLRMPSSCITMTQPKTIFFSVRKQEFF